MSQERLAEAARRNTKHIGQVERGQVDVGLDFLTSVAASLSVPLTQLFAPAWESDLCVISRRDAEQLERALGVIVRAKDAALPRARATRARSRGRSGS
jgi:transcriptional regulator with XRE-family HTH domain